MEALGNDDIRLIMKNNNLTQNWLAKEMRLSRQAIHYWITRRALTEDSDYRYRLLATYILKDSLGIDKQSEESLDRDRDDISFENLVGVKEIAYKLNKCPETIRRWFRKGKLKGVKLSNNTRYFITITELERLAKVAQ